MPRLRKQLFRPIVVHYYDAAGRRVPKGTPGAKRKRERSDVVWARYRDEHGSTVSKSLDCTDWESAQKHLADLIVKVDRRRAGLGSAFDDFALVPLAEHLAEFRRHLEARANTAEYIDLTVARLRTAFDGCSFRLLRDLNDGRVAHWLHEARTYARPLELGTPLTIRCKGATAKSYRDIAAHFKVTVSTVEKWRRDGAPIARVTRKRAVPNDLEAIRAWRLDRETSVSRIGKSTSNHYVRALRSFGRWLVRARRLPDNPFEAMATVKASDDIRHQRRRLSQADFVRLIEATIERRVRGGRGAVFRGLDGTDRAMLYLVAADTGFRASELASLTEPSLQLDGEPMIRVEARYTKSKELAEQPIRDDLAAKLRGWLPTRGQGRQGRPDAAARLWPGTWHEEAADMLRRDLAAAGIPYRDGGRVFDFHALRHQFISSLVAAGVHPKAAQKLARHSKIGLTMDVYTHLELSEAAPALDKLPPLAWPASPGDESQRLRATGTDGKNAPSVALWEENRGREGPRLATEGQPHKTTKAVASNGFDDTKQQRGRRDSNPQPPDRQASGGQPDAVDAIGVANQPPDKAALRLRSERPPLAAGGHDSDAPPGSPDNELEQLLAKIEALPPHRRAELIRRAGG
ncbi:MAG TPA: tyrosine-type recombinase/integrase [Acidimicrobiales bacterium]|nr:tyrosine-type recombinase/integrase [Acidimicrobiales bacterium]